MFDWITFRFYGYTNRFRLAWRILTNKSIEEEYTPYVALRSVLNGRIETAIGIAVQYGGIDGDHHKAWVIDQMVRILAYDKYESIVAEAKSGEDGPNTYAWNEGIAP